MKQFFGAFFGSILGIIIATIVAVFIIAAVITSGFKDAFKAEDNEVYKSKGNAVLHLVLDGPIIDRELKNPFANIDLGPFSKLEGMGLNVLLENLEKAKADTAIKGIYMDFRDLEAGQSALEELRAGLVDFKKSGKFIVSYAEAYHQGAYYLASVSDKIYLNPQGALDWKGLSMRVMFFKNTLEKLGIDMQIYRHGKFKSAVEPFMLDKMSDANRMQAETFLNSIWNNMLQDISKSRKVSVDELQSMANKLTIVFPEDAVKNGMVDELFYEDQVLEAINSMMKLGKEAKPNFVTHKSYSKYKPKEDGKLTKDNIAVIYAIGEIKGGEGSNDEIGSERIVKAIRKARTDKSIKAIVMRVNSPGGSALASDVIWREVVLAKKAKPFIVSMGDLAASGGYYISCAADKIFAEPNTITGSIGVFGVIPNLKRAYEDKLGIRIDTVNTNAHSDLMATYRSATPTESVFIQKSVESIYDVFIGKVAEGRKITKAEVDSIGQGRVWSGSDALGIHLVDELGGLNDAITYAAKVAKIDNVKIKELPFQKNPFDELFGKIDSETESRMLKKNIGEAYQLLKQAKSLTEAKGVQMRMPYLITIE